MPERDANQLAADVPRLTEIAEAADNGSPWEWEGGYPQRVVRAGDVVVVADCFESPDAPSRFAEFIATFDPPTVLSLVALVGTLQQERDDAISARLLWEEAVEKANDQTAYFQRLEATTARQRDDFAARAVAAEAALATTRQALAPFVEFLNPDALMQGAEWPGRFREYQGIARRALAAADGDTTEPCTFHIGCRATVHTDGCPLAGGDTKEPA